MLVRKAIEDEIADVIQRGDNRADVAYLADLFICKMFLDGENISQSRAKPENDETSLSESVFSQAIRGKQWAEIFPIIDEVMEVLQITNTRLYDSVIRKLNELP